MLLISSALVFGGCRERNPAWDGDEPSASTGTTVTGSSTGSPVSTAATGSSSSSSSGSVSDSGLPCNNTQQCPDGLVCGPETCQAGAEGDPCSAQRHCAEDSEICGSAGTCQDGSEGDPCDSEGDCSVTAPLCVAERCQDGSAGDPCVTPEDCAGPDPVCDADVCG